MTSSKDHPRWSLQDLLPGGGIDLEDILEQVETCVQTIERYRLQLPGDLPVKTFLELLHTLAGLRELTARIGGYAYLHYSENIQDASALSLMDRIDQTLTEVDNRTLFFSLWFKGLPDEIADGYIAEAG